MNTIETWNTIDRLVSIITNATERGLVTKTIDTFRGTFDGVPTDWEDTGGSLHTIELLYDTATLSNGKTIRSMQALKKALLNAMADFAREIRTGTTVTIKHPVVIRLSVGGQYWVNNKLGLTYDDRLRLQENMEKVIGLIDEDIETIVQDYKKPR